MGFWSTLGDVAKGVGQHVVNTGERAKELVSEYQDKSDDYLKDKCRSGSVAEKMAAVNVLKQRGYTSIR